MTKRKKPITQRWPGEWIFRGKIWTPERGSVATEGMLPEPLGPLVQLLMILGFTSSTFLTPKMKTILKKAAQEIGAEMERVNKREKRKKR